MKGRKKKKHGKFQHILHISTTKRQLPRATHSTNHTLSNGPKTLLPEFIDDDDDDDDTFQFQFRVSQTTRQKTFSHTDEGRGSVLGELQNIWLGKYCICTNHFPVCLEQISNHFKIRCFFRKIHYFKLISTFVYLFKLFYFNFLGKIVFFFNQTLLST